MCKVLALSALLADGNAKASIAPLLAPLAQLIMPFQHKEVRQQQGSITLSSYPEVNTLISLNTVAVISAVSILSGSQAVLAVAISASHSWVKSVPHFSWLYCDSLPSVSTGNT